MFKVMNITLRYGYTMKNGKCFLEIIECINGKDTFINEIEIDCKKLYLKLACNGQKLAFYYGTDGVNYKFWIRMWQAQI